MLNTLAIAAGGAVGALLRFWTSNGVHALLGRGFPYGTLSVNIIGSLAMGFLYVMFMGISPTTIKTIPANTLTYFKIVEAFLIKINIKLIKKDIIIKGMASPAE